MRIAARGKLTAAAGVVAALALLIGLGVAFRRDALEIWYLHRLETAPEEEANRLAGKLGAMGAARAVPKLAERFLLAGDASPQEAELRQALDRAAPGTEDDLIPTVQSADPEDIGLLLLVLNRVDADRRWRVAVLRGGLRHDEEHLRVESARKLRSLAPECTRALPELVRAVSDSSSAVRLVAVQTLASIGAKNTAVRAALQRATRDDVAEIRDIAANALAADDESTR